MSTLRERMSAFIRGEQSKYADLKDRYETIQSLEERKYVSRVVFSFYPKFSLASSRGIVSA